MGSSSQVQTLLLGAEFDEPDRRTAAGTGTSRGARKSSAKDMTGEA